MNKMDSIYREATPMEAKFYWETSDRLQAQREYALKHNDAHLLQDYYERKEKMVAVMREVGYRTDSTGLYVRSEQDILDLQHTQEVEDNTAYDFGIAMHVMRYGRK